MSLTGLSAGKSATLTLKALNGGVTVPSAGRTLRVVAVPDDGPEFDESAVELKLSRYVDMSYLAEVDTQTFASGSTLVFSKKSGTLPPGLKAKWNGSTALQISGAPTRPGNYVAVYQVSANNGTGTVPGLTTTISFSITDAAAKTDDGGEAPNPSVATSRTIKDIMIVDEGGALKGLLQVTIPPTGRASAKYVHADGTVSLSSKSWSQMDSGTGALSAELVGKSGWKLDLTANADGSVAFSLYNGDALAGQGSFNGKVWSAENPATDYAGYYTVTLPVSAMKAEADELAPTGAGYITVNLKDASNIKRGVAKWAGMLPNGTAVSGSTTLAAGEGLASLPVFKTSTKDVVSGIVDIREDAVKLREESAFYNVVTSVGGIDWIHREPEGSEASYEATLAVSGCLYDRDDDLEACCSEFFNGATNMWLAVEGSASASIVVVNTNSMKIEKSQNPLAATLGFNRATGVASGSLRLDGAYMSWKGVVLIGLGGCNICSAGSDTATNFPLVNGTAVFSETVPYEATTSSGKKVLRKVSIKHGSKIKVDVERSFE